MIVLEKYRVTIPNEEAIDSLEGYPFYIGKTVNIFSTFDINTFDPQNLKTDSINALDPILKLKEMIGCRH